MGIWSTLFGGGAAKVVDSVGGVLDNLFTSDEEREEAKRLMAQIDDKPHQDQRDINKVEAATAGKWSWHNALGWVCAISLFFYFVPQYLIAAIIWAKAALSAGWANGVFSMPPFPASADGLLELVVAMLGLAGKVTIERIAKVRPKWRP
ncbi:hypothetical protein [Pseudodesulfovibrio karagichevae]|uniref:Holin of 3TMs, for gene-transfer release n=1 Tax=Pseudodesulfovibrio karagichevae TaxID=3239305 RepID=A0ABV4JXH5_9BACT